MATATGDRVRRAAVLVLLLLAGHATAADVSLQAGVDRVEVAQDEVVTLQARLETPQAPSRWEFPRTRDFEVMGEVRSQERSISLGGGGGALVRQVFIVTWQLRPTRTGSLTIPSVRAVVGGREVVSQPIVVTVGAAGAAPSGPPGASAPGGAAYRGWEKDLALQVQVDRKEVYLGEQLTASFWLLTRADLVACDTTPPRYDGFWKEDLDSARPFRYEDRVVSGIPTRAYLIQRVALFPTRTGDLTIDPMELPRIQLRLGSRSVFGAFDDVVTATRHSEPVAVHVKPLPPAPPAGFETANVGALTLEGSASPPRVTVGEPITVRVSISGDGNVRALSAPRLPPFPGARTFQPTTRDEVGQRNRRLAGTRTVETVLVPERIGELVIPPADWPYFDPAAGKYQVARTPELKVTVVPAGLAGTTPAAPGSNALAAGLRPIRSDGQLSRRGPPAWERAWFLVLLLVPPLVFLSIAAVDRLRTRGDGARALRGAARSARRLIGAARRQLARGDSSGALGELERALLGYASDRLGRAASGLTREALSAELARAGAHPPAVRALLRALELVDASRYGAGGAHGEEVLIASERAVDALEEADWRAEAGG